MKRLSILLLSICMLLVGGCTKEKENVVSEGKETPSVNLIVSSGSEYFENGEYVDEENKEDGYYKQIYKYEDVDFTFERMKHKDYSDFPVAVESEKISNLKCNNKNINNEMNTKISYPVLKATYNTDDKYNEDILISTDEWDFRIHLETGKDKYEKNSSIIDDIVKNLKVDEID